MNRVELTESVKTRERDVERINPILGVWKTRSREEANERFSSSRVASREDEEEVDSPIEIHHHHH